MEKALEILEYIKTVMFGVALGSFVSLAMLENGIFIAYFGIAAYALITVFLVLASAYMKRKQR